MPDNYTPLTPSDSLFPPLYHAVNYLPVWALIGCPESEILASYWLLATALSCWMKSNVFRIYSLLSIIFCCVEN